jgi:DNA-binding transcriptional MocR family regulator
VARGWSLREYLSRLHERPGEVRREVVHDFENMGLEIFMEPADGMFVCARFPDVEDSLPWAEASQCDGIMLAPGAIFRPHLERSPWMRYNVTVCDDPRFRLERERKNLRLAPRKAGRVM